MVGFGSVGGQSGQDFMDALKDSKFQSSTTKGRIQEIQSIANKFMPQRGGNQDGGGSAEEQKGSTPNAGGSDSE